MEDLSVAKLVLGICMGLSLSAACGFRVFTPLLVVSVAVHFFGFPVNEGFQWVGSTVSLVVLSTATVCEIFAYYIPWVDNLLDTIHTPLALVAGTVVMSGMLPEVDPCLKWSAAGVLGSAAAGSTKVTSAALRGVSTATTGGLGNCIVSTVENVCSSVLSVLTVLVPVLAFIIAVVTFIIIFLVGRKLIAKAHGPVAERRTGRRGRR